MDLPAYQQLNIHMSTRGKRPLRNLTPYDKVRAIQRIHQGETKASVSRDIGVPESTLRGWCKNEQKLRFMCRQMNESNEFEQFSISKFENGQPAMKRNKLDTRNNCKSINNMENLIDNNKMSYLNDCNFDINNNSICENTLLEETLCEFLKYKALPDSNTIMKHNLVVKDKPISSRLFSSENTLSSIISSTNYKRYNSSAHNLNYFLMFNSNFMPILNTSSISAQSSEVGFSSEEDYNNETVNTSSYNMEGYDYNIFDINNNISQKRANNKNNNEFTDVSKLFYWYKIFNASLNHLALAANAAILPGSDVDTTNIKFSQKDLEEYIFDVQPIQEKITNYSYYEKDPEDLSIRSTVSTISSSNSKSSVSLESTTCSNSSQNDSE